MGPFTPIFSQCIGRIIVYLSDILLYILLYILLLIIYTSDNKSGGRVLDTRSLKHTFGVVSLLRECIKYDYVSGIMRFVHSLSKGAWVEVDQPPGLLYLVRIGSGPIREEHLFGADKQPTVCYCSFCSLLGPDQTRKLKLADCWWITRIFEVFQRFYKCSL